MLAAVWIAVAWWQSHKPLPAGTHVASPVCPLPADQIGFLRDLTAADGFGHPLVSEEIFDAVLALVHGARRFIVLDYGAFGGDSATAPRRHIAAELTDALLARRREQPDLAILFITDPVNERYGTRRADELQLLRAARVAVVTTDLDRLRDSNHLYSSLWRLTLRWWDGPAGPLGVESRRLNFKADDRRLIIADDGRGALAAVVGSASPQDSESGWSNVAARVRGGALPALLQSELAVARFSGWSGREDAFAATPPAATSAASAAQCAPAAAASTAARMQVITEGAIRAKLLERLDAAGPGDAIDIALFHLADRGVVEALLAAARRGVSVRAILDPNEAATHGGTEGLPNQPVASELVARSDAALHVRWYRTHGERFHGALVMIHDRQRLWLALGSAQLTARSLDDYNLAADVAVEVVPSAPLAQQALDYFDTLWSNRAAAGIEYTADFAVFANPAQSDYWLYRLMEDSGLSVF